ncbi:hypothetical protein BH09ACT7_BH09ACT7_01020 [soil metagenome]
MRPKLFVFNSVGRLGHDSEGQGGFEGRITVRYHFTQPGPGITLFSRTMTIEAYRDAPMPDAFFRITNPANIDAYHAAIARELALSEARLTARQAGQNARCNAAPCSANNCWLTSQSGSSESYPWQVPGATCSSVGTATASSRSA